MEYKFKIGDQVRVIESGSGYNPTCIGEILTILELGVYSDRPGYKTTRTKGNSNANDGHYKSMACEWSFELVASNNYEIF